MNFQSFVFRKLFITFRALKLLSQVNCFLVNIEVVSRFKIFVTYSAFMHGYKASISALKLEYEVMIFIFDMKKPKRNINLTRAPHAVVPDLQPARGDVVAGHQPHPGLRVLAPRRRLVAPVRAVRHGVAQRGHAPALPAAAPPLVLDRTSHDRQLKHPRNCHKS